MLGRIIKQGVQLKYKAVQQKQLPPIEAQLQTLKELLNTAAQTAFGKHYNFASIAEANNPIKAFQETVPVHDYNAIFERWWKRMLEGESDVAWAGKPKFFAMSSGTSGAPSKYIPESTEMLKSMRRASVRMILQSVNFDMPSSYYSKSFLMLGSSTALTERDKGLYVGDLSGINGTRIPFWFQRFYKPGRKISKVKDWEERIKLITEKAPKWDIGTISGIPAWIQLMLESIVKHHKLDNIHEIWPNFQIYTSGGVAFGPYKKGFDKLMGRPIMYLDTYLASEGFIAYQSRPEAERMAMRLVLDNGIFMEFVPFEERYFKDGKPLPDAPVYTVDTVEEGRDYALLISTCAGAWRYLIGDTVRFTDKERAEIIITGRTKHFLSICGEHLSVDNMNEALALVEKEMDVDVREFTVVAKKVGNRFGHEWYLGMDKKMPPTQVRDALDKHLQVVNADYKTERIDGLLDHVEVHTLPTEVFYQWQAKQGKMGGQSKFPRVLSKERFADWKSFLQETGNV